MIINEVHLLSDNLCLQTYKVFGAKYPVKDKPEQSAKKFVFLSF